VVSAQQLRRLRYSRDLIAAESSRGRLISLHRGVYAVGHRRLSWRGWCMAGVLAAEPNETDEVVWPAVASHASAAYLWGLFSSPPAGIDVTAPTRRRAKRDFSVHFSSILAEQDRGCCEGVPVTSLARTVLDLAIRSRPEQVARRLERSQELGAFDLRAFEDVLRRAGGHRGRGRLGRALEIYKPRAEDPAVLRSRYERRLRRLVREAGLPAPAMNFNVAGYELDAYWPGLWFAVEIDAFATHGSPAAFERDRLRQEELKLHGVEMVRITGVRLEREPAKVAARLRALLAQRREQLVHGGSPPPHPAAPSP
jgi:very-short-patch-repair endonuclease